MTSKSGAGPLVGLTSAQRLVTFAHMSIADGRGGGRGGRALLVGAALCGAAIAAACVDRAPVAPQHTAAASKTLPQATHYIVELSSPAAVPSLTRAVTAAGGRVLRTHDGFGLALVGGLSASAATSLEHEQGVRSVIPDFSMRLVHEPALRLVPASAARARAARGRVVSRGDPRSAFFFPIQWNMRNIHADSAWQVSTQGAGINVYILDSGVDTEHIDLRGIVDTHKSTSFAFADSDSLLQHPLPFGHDVAAHGTFVSSQIATNAIGIAAVAPKATLVMVRVLNDSGSGSAFALLNGILYATDNGADVINMSLGGYIDRTSGSFLAFGDLYQRVVDYAAQHGVLLVAAAGNESVNTNTATAPTGSYADSLNTPAGLHHVLSIGANGPVNQANFDQIATYSNYGSAGVGMFAPGGNTAVSNDTDLVFGACSDAAATFPQCKSDSLYLQGAGTSFASPLVAGEAAVVKAQRNGAISGQTLETCLLTSADEMNNKRPDPDYNFGRANVLSALKNSACQKSGS